MATLAEIRAKLLEKENKSGGNFGGGASNEVYPFWNIPEGSTATIRFLPDGDSNNTFFWVERLIIRLPFEGIIGQPDAKNTVVQVPCVEMWDKACPVLSEVRAWFKDPELEALGRKYWKKRSYIFQGFVLNDPMDEKEPPENPIRRFVINRSIFEIIRSSLMDAEMEEIPTDYQAGRDFKLVKTKRGQYADYSTSSWSMRTRTLGDDEMDAVNNFGLFDLKDYLPKEPSDKELEIIKEMFEASVNGEEYDPERWSAYYKPAGFRAAEDKSNVDTSSAKATPKAEESAEESSDTPPFDADSKEEEASSPTPSSPSAALSKLKQRVSEAKEEDDTSDDSTSDTEDTSNSEDGKPDHKQILEMIKKRKKSS